MQLQLALGMIVLVLVAAIVAAAWWYGGASLRRDDVERRALTAEERARIERALRKEGEDALVDRLMRNGGL